MVSLLFLVPFTLRTFFWTTCYFKFSYLLEHPKEPFVTFFFYQVPSSLQWHFLSGKDTAGTYHGSSSLPVVPIKESGLIVNSKASIGGAVEKIPSCGRLPFNIIDEEDNHRCLTLFIDCSERLHPDKSWSILRMRRRVSC